MEIYLLDDGAAGAAGGDGAGGGTTGAGLAVTRLGL